MVEFLDYLASIPVLRTYVQYLIPFCSWIEAASDVISGMYMRQSIFDKAVKFGDPRFNYTHEIWLNVNGDDIFATQWSDSF